MVNMLTGHLLSLYVPYKCSIANLEGVDIVTSNFCKHLSQACQRAFDLKEIKFRKQHSVRPSGNYRGITVHQFSKNYSKFKFKGTQD